MSVAELKERHVAATETVNTLREKLKQKRLQLLDTDGDFTFPFTSVFVICDFFERFLFLDLFGLVMKFCSCGVRAGPGRAPVSFGPTDLVCCRTLQGHTGKVMLCS